MLVSRQLRAVGGGGVHFSGEMTKMTPIPMAACAGWAQWKNHAPGLYAWNWKKEIVFTVQMSVC